MSTFLLHCCCVVCKQHLTSQGLNAHSKTHTSKIPTGYCGWCNHPLFNINDKYCSRSCAAHSNNAKRDYALVRPGPKQGTRPKNFAPYTRVSQCTICQRWHSGTGLTCGKTCKSTLLSIKMQKRMQEGFVPNLNRGRGKRSYLEESFSTWLDNTHPNIEYIIEHPFKRHDTNKTYFVDFFMPNLNLVIELDGSQHLNTTDYDRERDHYIQTTYGVTIVRITHAEYTAKTKLGVLTSLFTT